MTEKELARRAGDIVFNKLMKIVFAVMIILIIAGLICNCAYGQEFGQWRWSDQKFMEAPFDNSMHFGTGLISFTLDQTTNLKWWQSDLIAISAGILYEIKDGFCPYEKFGYWGGEGFSWVDVRTDIIGVAVTRMLNYSIRQVYRKFWKR